MTSDNTPSSGEISPEEGALPSSQELLDTLRRTAADFSNYRKRTIRDLAEATDKGVKSALLELLPIADATREGLASDAPSEDFTALAKALDASLFSLGLVSFGLEGDMFDPERYHSIRHETTLDGEGEVAVETVLRPGYEHQGALLRPALVTTNEIVSDQGDQTAGEENGG
jgi:molecular chaperone GrpE